MSGKAIRETLGFLTVVASMAFVGLEIRQNTAAQRAETRQGLADASREFTLTIATDTEARRVKSRFVCKSGGSSSPSARLLGRPPVSGGVRGRGNAGRPRRVWS